MPVTITVIKDIADYNPNDYAIVLVVSNYVVCRLREIMPMGSLGSIEELSTSPSVQFIKKAIKNNKRCVMPWVMAFNTRASIFIG